MRDRFFRRAQPRKGFLLVSRDTYHGHKRRRMLPMSLRKRSLHSIYFNCVHDDSSV